MKKILSVAVVAGVLSATTNFSEVTPSINTMAINNMKVTKQQQNAIKTYQDYLNFKNALNRMLVLQPAKASFILGSLYLKTFIFPSKTIMPNYNKALFYFKQSLEKGNYLAAYYIGLIENKRGNVYKALDVLQSTMNKIKKPDTVYNLLAIQYSSIVLDNLKNDKNAINKAIKYIEKVNANNDIAAYLFANLLYFSSPDNVKKASRILNYVCNKTKIKGLKKMCNTNPYIKGNEVPIHCPIFRKQER